MKAMVIGFDRGIGKALGDGLCARGDQITGTTRERDNVDDRTFYLDLNDVAVARTNIPKVDVVFFCAAVTSYSACRKDPEMAMRVNALAPAAIAARFVEQGARVVLLSTSAVLDCASPRMASDRPTRPASEYGRTKAQAEKAFLSFGPLASILRLTKVVTPDFQRFIEWSQQLTQGISLRCPNDLRFSPITLEHVVQALIAIAGQREGGIFQVSASADVSYAEAAYQIADSMNVPGRLVEGCSSAKLGIDPEVVTAYTSLDTTRLSEMTGFVAPDPRKVIDLVMGPLVAAARSSANAHVREI